MISHYFFDNQIRTYLLQFTSIFYGLTVRTGKDECGETQDISVPIVIGNKDRVVAALMAGKAVALRVDDYCDGSTSKSQQHVACAPYV